MNSRELIRAPPEPLLSTSSNNKIGPLPGSEVDRRISQYRELTVAIRGRSAPHRAVCAARPGLREKKKVEISG